MQTPSPLSRRRGRLMLLALAALFLGPLLFSWGYHKLGFTWHPEPKLAGQLITPPVQISLPADDRVSAGRWRLLVAGPCGEVCWRTLVDLRQIWRSLPRYQQALVRLYAHPDGQGLTAAQQRQMPALVQMRDPDGRLAAALASVAPGQQTAFVLVDPRGFAMLRYAPGYDPRGVREDLDHLLRRFVPN
ncbi:MAG: hypothetical protein Kow0073_03360 [Immundisolibacter sp.]